MAPPSTVRNNAVVHVGIRRLFGPRFQVFVRIPRSGPARSYGNANLIVTTFHFILALRTVDCGAQ